MTRGFTCHAGTDFSPMQRSTDYPERRRRADILLDALAEWDECYRRGEDRPATSFGISDPPLLAELQSRIATQKQLYAVMKLAETATDGPGQTARALPLSRP